MDLSTKLSRYNSGDLFGRFGRDAYSLAKVLYSAGCLIPRKHGPWLAGGAIVRALTGEKQSSDLDFFFASAEQHAAFVVAMQDSGLVASFSENIAGVKFKLKSSGFWPFRSPRPDVQAVKLKWFATPEAVLEDFDLTCCQFAYDGHEIITSELAIDDLKHKQLRVHKIGNPASTLHRSMRLSRRGFMFAPAAATTFLLGVQATPAAALTEATLSGDSGADDDDEETPF